MIDGRPIGDRLWPCENCDSR